MALYRFVNIVDWLSVVKTKPMGCVQVVQEGIDEVIVRDVVFQLDELVDPYWVALSTNLKRKFKFLCS